VSTCPQCAEHGVETELEPYAEVDIGVGVMQGGPWGCPVCHYVEDNIWNICPEEDSHD
jgi:hypothetical protein